MMRSGVSILALFTAGVVGVWYDPSDLSTLFQDSAGTTPVTSAAQPVGLMLDKSQGLVPGPQSLANNDFTNGTTGYTFSAPLTFTVNGSNQAVINRNSAGINVFPAQTALTAGKWYFVEVDVIALSNNVSVYFGAVSADTEFITSSTGIRSGYVRATGTALSFGPTGAAVATCTIASISVRLLPGNHAVQATAAKRPTYQTSAGLHWLAFDGTDDSMATAAIDFTGTDKVSVFAGVRKLSDAATGVIAEISADAITNDGTFSIFHSSSSTINGAGFFSKGTALSSALATAGFVPPKNAILTGLGNISGDSSIIRIDGVQRAASFADQGPGNYGNYVLNIGARGGTSLFFNGLFYGLVMPGKLASAAEIASTEAYMSAKTGVVL